MLLSYCTNDKGEFTKKLVTDGLKVNGIDKEEKKALQEVSDAFDAEAEGKKASKELEEAVIARYKKLTEGEIKTLLIQTKWIGAVSASIETVLDSVRRTLSGRLQTLASGNPRRLERSPTWRDCRNNFRWDTFNSNRIILGWRYSLVHSD